MELSYQTIIGFLSGTLATIILKGIIDFLQKRIDFKRDLEKTIHLKKVEAAEHAIKSMYQTYQSTLIIITAIDNLINKEMDGELFDSIWESYFKNISEGEEKLFTSPVSLYFTLENEELWGLDDQKRLFEVYSNVKILGDQIHTLNKEIESMTDEHQIGIYEDHIESELRKPLKKEFGKLSALLVKNSAAVFQGIQKIKSEYKNS